MPETDDISLLKQYTEGDESAFTVLVERYIHLIYSTALRQIGNPSHAEEITQAVFIILTQKAKTLNPKTILSGWLYQTARLTAANFLRSENSRQKREQEAYMQSLLNEPTQIVWPQIAPLLDDAMGQLNENDRNVVVLRFFQNKSAAEIGDSLGIDPSTAQKRITRAVGRLRKFFTKRSVSHSAEMIAGAISGNAIQVAPVGLTKSVTAVALAKGVGASATTLTLIKGALKIMAWSKAKTAIVVGVGILLAAGTTTVAVKKIEQHKADESWRVRPYDSRVLDWMPPEVEILPAKLPRGGGWGYGMHGKMMGTGVGVETIVQMAYESWSSARTIFSTELPKDSYYDIVSSLPSGNAEALQQEIKKQFGVVATHETVETNALLLEVKFPNSQGLRLNTTRSQSSQVRMQTDQFSCVNTPISDVVANLEDLLQIPVIDQTGITNKYDVNLKWNRFDPQHTSLKQALTDQLGLELVPTNMPIEMLVVEKAN